MNDAGWTTGTVVVDGTRLHYRRAGDRERPTLVLLHGVTDDGTCWARVARDLETEFDIVMPDARGHGRSDPVGQGLAPDRLAADVAGLLDGLEITTTLVFGHSMGAITAAWLAADRPDLVLGCVLEDPPLDAPPAPTAERIDELRAETAFWRALPTDERHERAAITNPGWDRQETDPWADAKALVDLGVADWLGSIRSSDWRAALGHIRCPGLLLTGDTTHGALVSERMAEEAAFLWPAGRIAHIRGAGHCVHRDRWDETMVLVRGFLREQVVLGAQPPA